MLTIFLPLRSSALLTRSRLARYQRSIHALESRSPFTRSPLTNLRSPDLSHSCPLHHLQDLETALFPTEGCQQHRARRASAHRRATDGRGLDPDGRREPLGSARGMGVVGGASKSHSPALCTSKVARMPAMSCSWIASIVSSLGVSQAGPTSMGVPTTAVIAARRGTGGPPRPKRPYGRTRDTLRTRDNHSPEAPNALRSGRRETKNQIGTRGTPWRLASRHTPLRRDITTAGCECERAASVKMPAMPSIATPVWKPRPRSSDSTSRSAGTHPHA